MPNDSRRPAHERALRELPRVSIETLGAPRIPFIYRKWFVSEKDLAVGVVSQTGFWGWESGTDGSTL